MRCAASSFFESGSVANGTAAAFHIVQLRTAKVRARYDSVNEVKERLHRLALRRPQSAIVPATPQDAAL